MPMRVMRLSACALVAIVVAVVSCSRTSYPEEEKGEMDDLVLAKVGNKTLTVGDLRSKLRYQFRSMKDLSGPAAVDQYRELVRSAAEELCWVTLGEKKGYEKDPAFKITAELSRRYILADRTIEHEVRAKEVPTDAEIDQFYDENRNDYIMPTRVQIAHVLLPTEPEAQAIRRRLLAGEPVSNLAARYSTDMVGKTQGGLVGWVTASSGAGHLGNQSGINAAAMKLQPGEVSMPVRIPTGWSVIVALAREEERQRVLDDALRETIRKRVQTKKHNEIYSSLLAELKKEYDFEVNEENYDRYARSLLNEEELFSMAQRQKDPKKRVGDYEEIVRRFPQSPGASQAAFMVGFTLADELKEYDEARDAFREFLKKYPDHELAPSARWMIDNMDKPDADPAEVDEMRRQLRSGR